MPIGSTQPDARSSSWTFRPATNPSTPANQAALTKQATMAPDVLALQVATNSARQGAQVVQSVAAKNPQAAANVVSDVAKVDTRQAAAVVSTLATSDAKQAKDVVAKVASQNPGKAAQLMATLAAHDPMQALSLMVGALAGNTAITDLGASLAVRNNVTSLKGAANAIASAHPESENVVQATYKALGTKADEAINPASDAKLSGLGRLGSSLSALAGLNALLNLGPDVKAFHEKKSFDNANALASDGLFAVRGANDAAKLLKNSPIGFIGTRAVLGLSVASDATDMVRRIKALEKPDLKPHERISDAAFLAGDTMDAVGSGLMATGVGLPVGMGLKLAAAGLAVVGIGAQHAAFLKKTVHGLEKAVASIF